MRVVVQDGARAFFRHDADAAPLVTPPLDIDAAVRAIVIVGHPDFVRRLERGQYPIGMPLPVIPVLGDDVRRQSTMDHNALDGHGDIPPVGLARQADLPIDDGQRCLSPRGRGNLRRGVLLGARGRDAERVRDLREGLGVPDRAAHGAREPDPAGQRRRIPQHRR